MSVNREGFSATPLPDGRVLVAGGSEVACNSGCVFDSPTAELYNLATGRFSATGSMKIGREYHTATLLASGEVLIAGGDPNRHSRVAELYNPATGKFTDTGSMTESRVWASATRLRDGQVLIAGGVGKNARALSSAEIYDPATRKFTPTGSMKTARENQTAIRLTDGRVLIAGGDDGINVGDGSIGGNPIGSAEIYDPATDKFSPTGAMITPRTFAAATPLPGGAVLVTGGQGNDGLPVASLERYEATRGAFVAAGTGATAESGGWPNDCALEGSPALALEDGQILILWGSGPAQLYSPPTLAISTTASPLKSLAEGGGCPANAILLRDGSVLVLDREDPTAQLYWP